MNIYASYGPNQIFSAAFDLASMCRDIVEELIRATFLPELEPVPLENKHVGHLFINTSALLEQHKDSEIISIALPPLACTNRYHYANIYIKSSCIKYRGVRSVQDPSPTGELHYGDNNGQAYYYQEALNFANYHWGNKLCDPSLTTKYSTPVRDKDPWTFTFPNEEIYATTFGCEAFEFQWLYSLRREDRDSVWILARYNEAFQGEAASFVKKNGLLPLPISSTPRPLNPSTPQPFNDDEQLLHFNRTQSHDPVKASHTAQSKERQILLGIKRQKCKPEFMALPSTILKKHRQN
ncbi:hypothetical protein B7494_g5768 [Chlorociboria aeruginascens]|nr:hypothetical protein B7494_g5768 [Chlorociboria aeruginascens]